MKAQELLQNNVQLSSQGYYFFTRGIDPAMIWMSIEFEEQAYREKISTLQNRIKLLESQLENMEKVISDEKISAKDNNKDKVPKAKIPIEEIIALYDEEYSVAEIARHFNYSAKNIKKRLEHSGIDIEKRNYRRYVKNASCSAE